MTLLHGDCLEVLRALEDNSLDALITDPPAGISFMGKDWDSNKGGRDNWIAWMTEVMRECLRVLKPGAHGFVWAIPRTSHWTATALENAGFDVRDVVTHLFGSGFPKSLDISKAIDKAAGAEREVVGLENPYADGKIRRATGNISNANDNVKFASEYKLEDGMRAIKAPATEAAKQWQGWGTALKPASEHWILVRKKDIVDPCEEIALSVIPSTTLTLHGLKEAEDLLVRMLADSSEPQEAREKILQLGRAVNGLDTTAMSLLAKSVDSIDLSIVSSWKNISDADLEKVKTFITSMVTKRITESKISNCSPSQSTPNDTTLAPSSEHYILIRKPCSEKTVAANVLKHGTGGINIDGCRIEGASWSRDRTKEKSDKSETFENGFKNILQQSNPQGRFPANLILDEVAAESLGVNARYFYCAKASKRERGDGNTHPTVKSIKLMTYLCRMITPPNGTVLDPFMGSGSTGVAAVKEGFKFVGIEQSSEYLEIAKRRIEAAL